MVRLAKQSDLEAIAGLEILLFPENSINENSLRKELSWSRATVYGDPARAYLLARFGPVVIDILRVGVHPDARRRGIARMLMEEVLDLAYLPVMLTVKKENAPARMLYASLGFTPVAVLPQAEALLLLRPTSSST